MEEKRKTEVICCRCLHKHRADPDETVSMFSDFPERAVEINGDQWSCPACDNNTDVIIFGRAFISTNAGNMDHPLVKENNDICYKRRKLMIATSKDPG